MKKTRLIAALLAVSFMIGSMSVHAQEEGRLSRAKKTFNESLKRFRKCMRREQCTNEEWRKVARDLGIAALVVAAIVTTGAVARKVLVTKPPTGPIMVPPSAFPSPRGAARKLAQVKKNFPEHKKVRYTGQDVELKGRKGEVLGHEYNPEEQLLTVQVLFNGNIYDVSPNELELISPEG